MVQRYIRFLKMLQFAEKFGISGVYERCEWHSTRENESVLYSTHTQDRMSQNTLLYTHSRENESLCSTCTQERSSQTWKTLFTAFINMSPLALSSTNSLFLTQYVFNEVLYQGYAKPKPCVAQLQYSAKQVVSHS